MLIKINPKQTSPNKINENATSYLKRGIKQNRRQRINQPIEPPQNRIDPQYNTKTIYIIPSTIINYKINQNIRNKALCYYRIEQEA